MRSTFPEDGLSLTVCKYFNMFITKIKDVKIYDNYQLLAVVLLSDLAKVLEPSPPYPGKGHPNEHKVYRVSMYANPVLWLPCYLG